MARFGWQGVRHCLTGECRGDTAFSALGPPLLRGCTAVDNVTDDDDDADADAFADALTTVAASLCDRDDALGPHCVMCAHHFPPCSLQTHSRAPLAVYFP